MSFITKLCLNVKSCNKILCLNYGTQLTPPLVKKTLVEALKYRFRIQAAQKKDLQNARQGVTPLTKISVDDVRTIWIYTLLAEQGLPSSKVYLSEEVVVAMESQLRAVLTYDENDLVEFEDYLPTMVDLIRTKVTSEEEQEIANELFDVWFPNKTLDPELKGSYICTEADLKDLKIKPNFTVAKTILFLKKFIPL